MTILDNLNVDAADVLITPQALKDQLPASATAQASVAAARKSVTDVIAQRDPRLLVIVGPCSIHDPQAALEYARRLAGLAAEVDDQLLLVMRAYFEKPRTTVGWKGLINDPHLDDTFQVHEGLAIARRLLIDVAELGLGLSTEALDPISPQYLQDLIAWSAIGARTAESQTHREMASGLSSAVGFKNGTDGGLGVAINALQSVRNPHRFLGINAAGQVSVIKTRGNEYAHVVLRGGTDGPNYSASNLAQCADALASAGLEARIMVDCSHANSNKDHNNQPLVAEDVIAQYQSGNRSIIGLMLESNLNPGNQPLTEALEYGVSITDACISWEQTATLIKRMHKQLKRG